MSANNPFTYDKNPYRSNPFTVLGVGPEMKQAEIEGFANAREGVVAAGIQPDPELELQPGDCIRAAQHLQDAVLRLAFDLMAHWPEPDNEEKP